MRCSVFIVALFAGASASRCTLQHARQPDGSFELRNCEELSLVGQQIGDRNAANVGTEEDVERALAGFGPCAH